MVLQLLSIPFVNLVLCIVIVILGFLCFKKSGERLPAFIGAAFGLFGISHAATIAGLAASLELPLIVIRTLAYVLVIVALWLNLKSTLMQKETRQAWVDYFRGETAPDEKK
ncbi:hypothetical protein [Methanoregula formicica]|uniref:Uncharacterized protein n=1 Tax=Methanoregula formicica (strain DSM 22288 / NBRC 105244 / SMSP) TaxID=593750 RepID=L0HGU7_METFS|nr:hypothetical protein [Methanoregula formicica]AGB03220.1 hypothetical protein Metfor_2214 [Methanoregula formicica SMSP]